MPTQTLRIWLYAAIILPLLLFAHSVNAAVTITFYSHDFGDRFPHAFVVLNGTVDATGETVDTNYGFTAVNVTPAILWGRVLGKVETSEPQYVARSRPHFSIELTDAQYAQVLAKAEEWRTKEQKNYSLNKANCVHFVSEMAQLLGLNVNPNSKLYKKPKSFLYEVTALNPGLRLGQEAAATREDG